ncbi:helix-turn-helix domain-containing protein [Nocardia sp. NBC_00416]|uniref:helix-turn-helix domain-containing protein n=1 Tax=Nocardia sp. NBC_00416 TaxID=2975991 RepID=UPI002E1D9192
MKAVTIERMSREQRREQLAAWAAAEFARAGLHGTSTEALARRAGITQTYVFRLFGTKKELFLTRIQAGLFDHPTEENNR